MQLKFHSRAGHTCRVPGQKFVGQPPRSVGRRFEPVNDKAAGVAAREVATKEPFELSDLDPMAEHMIRCCKLGEIWPADEATAAVCGLTFAPLEQDSDGEWDIKKAAEKPAAKPAKASD